MTHEENIHFEVFKGARWNLTRAVLRQYLEPIVVKYGCAVTRTPVEDTRQIRFNKALGFEYLCNDDYDMYAFFRITNLERLGLCQQ